jgi:Tat protein translocase TatB subunit
VPFNLSFTHLMVVGIVALVVLGPERLPEVARTAGSLFREWKRIRGDLEGEVREAISDFREPFLDSLNDLRATSGNLSGGVSSSSGSTRPPAPPLSVLPPLGGATSDDDLRPLSAGLPVLGPGTGLVSPGPVLQVEVPTLGPPPDLGTFTPYEPPA